VNKPLLKSKLFWVGVLYFAEGFPLGIFYDVFPVYFRQQGIELKQIGLLSLLGLGWTLKFLWAPAVDHYRHHRLWMFSVDLLMGALSLWFAISAGFGIWVWIAIGAFTVLSATNDIAIDGYTIEFLEKHELGLANGVRISLYRIGVLASGFLLVLSDHLEWRGAFITAAVIFCVNATLSLLAPKERQIVREKAVSLASELKNIVLQPYAFGAVLLFILGTIWLINRETKWSSLHPNFWVIAFLIAFLLWALSLAFRSRAPIEAKAKLTEGPMFGALMEMLGRPYIIPVIAFVLIFKLADSAMGFMIKPFWVDAGFSATEIGLVSVNIGLILSIAGGLAGGWFTDKVGIFQSLWILGLAQAFSNLGYWLSASLLPLNPVSEIPLQHQALIYTASALESFTGGLGTAAFLAFLMAIVDKKHAATEYALLSSVFALSRSFSGWAGGVGAQAMGYAPYFLLTFFLAFPAYLLLPWVKKMLRYTDDKA
jgi:PAT family beta-lactamase induction signal transducer AmpG